LLVVNGELIAATLRTPGLVVGDGSHSVRELVELVNLDPRRGVGHSLTQGAQLGVEGSQIAALRSHLRREVGFTGGHKWVTRGVFDGRCPVPSVGA